MAPSLVQRRGSDPESRPLEGLTPSVLGGRRRRPGRAAAWCRRGGIGRRVGGRGRRRRSRCRACGAVAVGRGRRPDRAPGRRRTSRWAPGRCVARGGCGRGRRRGGRGLLGRRLRLRAWSAWRACRAGRRVRCRAGWREHRRAASSPCGARGAAPRGGLRRRAAVAPCGRASRWLTSTAPPAVSAAVQTTAATLQAARRRRAAARAAAGGCRAARGRAAAGAAEAEQLRGAIASGPTPTGLSAANERRMPRSAPRYSVQPSQLRMCRRARPDAFTPRS